MQCGSDFRDYLLYFISRRFIYQRSVKYATIHLRNVSHQYPWLGHWRILSYVGHISFLGFLFLFQGRGCVWGGWDRFSPQPPHLIVAPRIIVSGAYGGVWRCYCFAPRSGYRGGARRLRPTKKIVGKPHLHLILSLSQIFFRFPLFVVSWPQNQSKFCFSSAKIIGNSAKLSRKNFVNFDGIVNLIFG